MLDYVYITLRVILYNTKSEPTICIHVIKHILLYRPVTVSSLTTYPKAIARIKIAGLLTAMYCISSPCLYELTPGEHEHDNDDGDGGDDDDNNDDGSGHCLMMLVIVEIT